MKRHDQQDGKGTSKGKSEAPSTTANERPDSNDCCRTKARPRSQVKERRSARPGDSCLLSTLLGTMYPGFPTLPERSLVRRTSFRSRLMDDTSAFGVLTRRMPAISNLTSEVVCTVGGAGSETTAHESGRRSWSVFEPFPTLGRRLVRNGDSPSTGNGQHVDPSRGSWVVVVKGYG